MNVFINTFQNKVTNNMVLNTLVDTSCVNLKKTLSKIDTVLLKGVNKGVVMKVTDSI